MLSTSLWHSPLVTHTGNYKIALLSIAVTLRPRPLLSIILPQQMRKCCCCGAICCCIWIRRHGARMIITVDCGTAINPHPAQPRQLTLIFQTLLGDNIFSINNIGLKCVILNKASSGTLGNPSKKWRGGSDPGVACGIIHTWRVPLLGISLPKPHVI